MSYRIADVYDFWRAAAFPYTGNMNMKPGTIAGSGRGNVFDETRIQNHQSEKGSQRL
jgi:hypothetical protein